IGTSVKRAPPTRIATNCCDAETSQTVALTLRLVAMSADTPRAAAPPLGIASISEEPSYAARHMTAASRQQVRGWRVVEKVLEATLEELSDKGYGALSIEDVAARAGVAKTTIYRRWPAKADLALDAMRRVADSVVVVGDTGALRSDLIAMLK